MLRIICLHAKMMQKCVLWSPTRYICSSSRLIQSLSIPVLLERWRLLFLFESLLLCFDVCWWGQRGEEEEYVFKWRRWFSVCKLSTLPLLIMKVWDERPLWCWYDNTNMLAWCFQEYSVVVTIWLTYETHSSENCMLGVFFKHVLVAFLSW